MINLKVEKRAAGATNAPAPANLFRRLTWKVYNFLTLTLPLRQASNAQSVAATSPSNHFPLISSASRDITRSAKNVTPQVAARFTRREEIFSPRLLKKLAMAAVPLSLHRSFIAGRGQKPDCTLTASNAPKAAMKNAGSIGAKVLEIGGRRIVIRPAITSLGTITALLLPNTTKWQRRKITPAQSVTVSRLMARYALTTTTLQARFGRFFAASAMAPLVLLTITLNTLRMPQGICVNTEKNNFNRSNGQTGRGFRTLDEFHLDRVDVIVRLPEN